MPKLRVASFGVSLDGFGAGHSQSLENPLGINGPALFQWFFPTRTFQSMHTNSGEGTTGPDNDFAARGFENVGAWIIGRNMFGPVRGPWPDDSWRGWWGDEPPYHTPVFVLTHHPREPLSMQGGTTFHFISGEMHSIVNRAFEAANGKDVRIGGGVSTIRQFLRAGLIDELHLAVAPTLLGAGEPFFAGIDLHVLGYQVAEHTATENALHLIITKKPA